MPLDPSIILGAKPVQFDMAQFSPMNALTSAMKIKQFDQESQMNALKMEEYKRARTEEDELRNFLATKPDLANPDTRTNLLRLGKTGLAYGKALSEQDTAELTRQEKQLKIQKDRKDFITQAQRDTSQNPSDANITAYLEDLQANPLFTAAEKKQMADGAARLLAMPVPERASFMASQGASASDLKPSVQQVNQAGQTQVLRVPAFGSGAPTSIGTYADVPLPANVQAQKIQIAQQSRPPPQPRAEQPPVAVVGPDGRPIYVSREQAMGMTPAAAMESLPPKEIQKREAALPQATSAIKGFETKSDSFVSDLMKLRDHPGLSQITGLVAGRVPAITADGRAAQALYDKVVAKGGFQALQDMRDASKTGGALGNVSNQEGKQLTASFAAINRVQDAKDVKAAIDEAVSNIQGAKTRMREAYEATYSYKSGGGATTPAAAPNIDALLNKYK